jgi:hypothetical protein
MNYYNGRLRGYLDGHNVDFQALRNAHDIVTTHEDIPDSVNVNTASISAASEDPTSSMPKKGNGHARLTYLDASNAVCTKNQVYDFPYTGTETVYSVPCTGNYKMEVWGGQGGGNDVVSGGHSRAGAGGYSGGEITLQKGEILYINVGGRGNVGARAAGGYNGGGNTGSAGGSGGTGAGGGATHIATMSGLLSTLEENKDSVIIVAGGGGGADDVGNGDNGTGGSAGGYIGGAAYINGSRVSRNRYIASTANDGGCGQGGTQTEGFAFGQGESVTSNTDAGAAGGGWYGGYVTNHNSGGGGGGSGYIGNPRLSNKQMVGYEVPVQPGRWVINYLKEKDAFLEVKGHTYNNLPDAIAALGDDETGTITMIGDGLNSEETIFPSGKTII